MYSIPRGCCVAERLHCRGAHYFQPASASIPSSSLSDRIVYCLEGMETKAECACLLLTYLSFTLHKWKC